MLLIKCDTPSVQCVMPYYIYILHYHSYSVEDRQLQELHHDNHLLRRPYLEKSPLYKEQKLHNYQQLNNFINVLKKKDFPTCYGRECTSTDLPQVSPVQQELVAPWVGPA